MCQVTILPGELVLNARRGASLRELLLQEGLLLDFPCGGRGLCGQCAVQIQPPTRSGRGGRKALPEEALARGLRLACQVVIEGDCTIRIPEERGVQVAWQGPAEEQGSTALYGEKLIRRRRLQLAPPSLEDQRADWERLTDALREPGRPAPVLPPVEGRSVEALARALREGQWRADAVLEQEELLCLRPAREPPEAVYGFAVDLGTTTVDLSLHNLESGRLVGRRALLNRQTAFGADVISRTNAYQEKAEEVRAAALRTIEECARQLEEEAGLSPEQVARTTVVGNPIMIHILHGLNPRQLATAPYIPLVSGLVRRRPQEFDWGFQGSGWVETLPLISAFVGADTVGMILALDLEHERQVSLSIDIGTNGEIVLSRAEELLATSTAAGPAFEGAQISCGMRALEGAVTGLRLLPDGALELAVIGGGAPKGLCGSGLISGVAELLEAGLLEPSGRLLPPAEVRRPELAAHLFLQEGVPAFRLSERVYISQRDIRELQLAKGAIRTGIDLLLDAAGVQAGQLERVRLAGNFGSGLDVARTIRLGLIPPLPAEKVDVVGNAALRGAALALVSREYRERAARVHRQCRFLELAARPDFQTRFAESMFF